jgi:hypothetical protein
VRTVSEPLPHHALSSGSHQSITFSRIETDRGTLSGPPSLERTSIFVGTCDSPTSTRLPSLSLTETSGRRLTPSVELDALVAVDRRAFEHRILLALNEPSEITRPAGTPAERIDYSFGGIELREALLRLLRFVRAPFVASFDASKQSQKGAFERSPEQHPIVLGSKAWRQLARAAFGPSASALRTMVSSMLKEQRLFIRDEFVKLDDEGQRAWRTIRSLTPFQPTREVQEAVLKLIQSDGRRPISNRRRS